TRLVYPTVDTLGNILMYSLRTINNLYLTLVFPADTHMATIRKQAALIRDAMNQIPDPIMVEAVASAEEEAEPEASITQINRPTDLRPPDGLHEAVAPLIPLLQTPM